jgi:hypothetical protein
MSRRPADARLRVKRHLFNPRTGTDLDPRDKHEDEGRVEWLFEPGSERWWVYGEKRPSQAIDAAKVHHPSPEKSMT